MISAEQLKVMLQLQNLMNAKVNEQWMSAQYPWMRAVVVEGTEALEHLGWKWWKRQTPNIPQLRIELVDIWHFALSDVLVTTAGNVDQAADSIFGSLNSHYQQLGIMFDGQEYLFSKLSPLKSVELMIGLAAAQRFSFTLFAKIMTDVKMSWNDLFTGYVAKNVLNTFRQDHGYKNGTYIKDWAADTEDNVVLETLCAKMDPTSVSYAADLYKELAYAYAAVLSAHGRMLESAAVTEKLAK